MQIAEKLRSYITGTQTEGLLEVYLELCEIIREKQVGLLEKRRQALFPKDKEFTDLDRKVHLDGALAQYEADYDFLLRLEFIVRAML